MNQAESFIKKRLKVPKTNELDVNRNNYIKWYNKENDVKERRQNSNQIKLSL